jgi:DNA-binding transcriptional regulator LsrR (DeoR family)
VEEKGRSLTDFGEKAAEILGEMLRFARNIGVSWGETLAAAVSRVPSIYLPESAVIQMVGGLNSGNMRVNSDEIARMLAAKLSCAFHLMYAPAMVESEMVKTVLMGNQAIKAMFDRIQICDIALLGVGELKKSSTIFRQGYLTEQRLEDLLKKGFVGDMAMQFFDREGRWAEQNNVIGVAPETLRNIPNVIALACGEKKTEAVLGAIKTGCVNVLIIDRSIALKISDTKKPSLA